MRALHTHDAEPFDGWVESAPADETHRNSGRTGPHAHAHACRPAEGRVRRGEQAGRGSLGNPQSAIANPQSPASHSVRGFTLVELIVSMGVLVGLMTMVGMIFSIATEAASTGTANMSVRRFLRMTRKVIESDLQAFDPAGGALAIYGWEQLAYASTDDRAGGRSIAALSRVPNNDEELDYRPPFDYHRADVLMLVTRARAGPYALHAPGTEGTGQIQVYGHADFGEIITTGSLDPTKHKWETGTRFRRLENGRLAVNLLGVVVGHQPSALPASQWHLARRATVFTRQNTGLAGVIGNWIGSQYRLTAAATRDRIYRAGSDTTLGNGSPGGDLLDRFDLDEALSVWAASTEGIPDDWYYPDVNRPDRRTIVDQTPPPGQQGRLAYQFLPGCVEFKVEVTFDEPSMVFDRTPADPFVDLQPAVNWFTVPSGKRLEWIRGQAAELNDTKNQNATQASSRPSWANALGRAYGYPPLGFDNKLRNGTPPDPLNPPFPTAVRITMRVMDENESLYSPEFRRSTITPGTEDLVSDGAITEIIVHKF